MKLLEKIMIYMGYLVVFLSILNLISSKTKIEKVIFSLLTLEGILLIVIAKNT